MSPIQNFVAKRDTCVNSFGETYNCYSTTWNSWGRWVAAVVLIFVVLLIALAFSCINSRRRRRMGVQPMYGTGWMAKPPPYGNNNGNYYGGPPAPPYQQHQPTGNTFNTNDGYYGQHNQHVYPQQEGIELQSPQHAYAPQRGGDDVYDAPTGPPPTKGDGIIR